jgi:integrase/recombinase XerD
VDYESHAVALDRNELGALLVAAGLATPGDHALISLLALNGLRVSEAAGADIEHLGLERGHRTLTITRKTPQGLSCQIGLCRQAGSGFS